jgi:phage gp29-like protein
MYTESYAGNSILPKITQALNAFKIADTEKAHRDMRKLMFYLQDMSEADGIIRNLVRIRRVGVNSFSWQIVADDEKDNDAAQQTKIRCRKIIKSILKYHTDTPMFGAMAFRYKFEKKGNDFIPLFVKRYKPVEIERDENPELLRIWENGDDKKKFNIKPADRDNWILDSDESIKPGGTLRSILIRAILAKDMEVEWSNYNKMVKGLIQAIVSDITSKEDVEAAESTLQDLITRKYAITDELTKFEFKEVVSAIGADSFNKFLERIEKIFAKTLIGNANTTELPAYGGSRAALWVLKTISADVIYEDIMRCQDMINDQLLASDYRVNFGAGKGECPWRFSFVIPEEIDLEKRVAVIEGCQRAGIALKTDEVYNAIEFTKPEDVPDVMFGETPVDNNPTEV